MAARFLISRSLRQATGCFTLKDDTAQVRCAMFRNSNRRVTFPSAARAAGAGTRQYYAVRAARRLSNHRRSIRPAGEGLLQQK